MTDHAISMWRIEETAAEDRTDLRTRAEELFRRMLYDPDMRTVYSGPGGLPFLLRLFVKKQGWPRARAGVGAA